VKLDDPVQYVKESGRSAPEILAKSGYATLEDLLYHLPFRYEDRRHIAEAASAPVGADATLVGRITGVREVRMRGRGRSMLQALFRDETAAIALVWFHQASYFKKRLESAQRWLVHGRVERARRGGIQIVHPEIEPLDEESGRKPPARILPVYQKPGDLPLSAMRAIVEHVVLGGASLARSVVPEPVRRRLGLEPLERALRTVHIPPPEIEPEALAAFATGAHRTLIFEELFALQVGMTLRKLARAAEPGIAMAPSVRSQEFLRALPFEPTARSGA
jgi:ATP-dependent DNA helicase RecG